MRTTISPRAGRCAAKEGCVLVAMNTNVDANEKPKLQEYATEIQIEFFDRLRSGDDPVHEHARTELVTLANDALELLGSLRVDKIDFDAEVRRVLTKLEILAGYEVEEFTLEVHADGYDVADEQLMADLSDAAKARFSDEQKLVRALLDEPEVTLEESEPGCCGYGTTYHFSTKDPVIAAKYGFVDDAEREAEAEEARAAAEQRAAEAAKAVEAFWARIKAEGLEAVTASIRAQAVALKGEDAVNQIWKAIESLEKEPAKQIQMLSRVVGVATTGGAQ